MGHTRTWNTAYEASPADTQDASQGATRIRELKLDIRERFDLDHIMDEDDTNDGRHRYITFIEQAGAPGNLANTGRLYALDVGGVTELHWIDSAGNAYRITNAGAPLLLDTNNAWTAGQGMARVNVAYASPLTLDAAEGNRFVVGALTGNLTLNPPSNPSDGQVLSIKLEQDGTGGRTLTFGATIYGSTANDWTLTTAANAIDELILEYDGDDARWRALALHKDINNAL